MLHIVEVIEQLEQAQSPNAALDALDKSKTLNDLGVEHFCVALPVHPGLRFEDCMMASKQPPAWLELYLKENYCQTDAALRHCKEAVKPFRWLDAPFDPEREKPFLEVVQRANDFNVDRGFMVPVHGREGYLGSVWMSGYHLDQSRLTPSDCLNIGPILYPISIYAFHRVRQLVDHLVIPEVTLSERQKEILRWTAVGKSAWDISEILNISNRTVEWHIAQAMKKIGATNRVQVVVLALKRGLITI
jgi:LuxR family quorum sensing-dependent transcriptional regulator